MHGASLRSPKFLPIESDDEWPLAAKADTESYQTLREGMSTLEQTTLHRPESAAPGLFERILKVLSQIFGGGRDTSSVQVMPGSRLEDTAALEPSEPDEFIIAPCGYPITVPKASDFSHSVSDMLPSVREGLSLLPPLPTVAMELLRELQNSSSTAASVAAIAASDPSLAASLIRTVNGAAMSLSRKITSVSEAVSYLGFGLVKGVVVRLRLEEVLAPKNEQDAQDAEDLWVHSLAVSYVAEKLAHRVDGVDPGFVATLGLLHDIGKLAILAQWPQEAQRLRDQAKADPHGDPRAREAKLLGADHAAIGAHLALNWKLPADLIQAVRWHHRPANAFELGDPPALRKAVHLLQIANQLTKFCYPYSDQMKIEHVSDETFSLLGLEPSLSKLLDAPVRAAITRAIFFADSNTRRPAAAPRRFLRLLSGEAAKTAISSSSGGEPRIEEDDVAISGLLSSDLREVHFSADGSADGSHPTQNAGAMHCMCAATPKAVEKCLKALREHQDAMDLPADSRSAAALIVRSMLPNLLQFHTPNEVIQVGQACESRKLKIALRGAGLSVQRRLAAGATPEIARRLAEADLASLLNLGWCERIVVSGDGSAILFCCN